MSKEDELIQEIFAAQDGMYPDQDPGDLCIVIQDDSQMVEISQDGWRPSDPLTHPGLGRSLEDALENYLQSILAGRVEREDQDLLDYLVDIFDLESAIATKNIAKFEKAVVRIRRDKFGVE